MPSSWPALHAQLFRSTQTLAFQVQFRALTGSEAALTTFFDPASLFDALHGPGGDAEARNDILAGLARQSKVQPEPSTTLLLLALWPGLDAVYRRLVRHFAGRSDHLASEISTRVVEGIRNLDLDRVRRIAATLIRNCQRDIIRSLKKSAVLSKLQVELTINVAVEAQACADPDRAILMLVQQLRPVVGRDAPLVVALAVAGDRQREVATALGLSHDATRKRYQRALKRIRVVVEEIF